MGICVVSGDSGVYDLLVFTQFSTVGRLLLVVAVISCAYHLAVGCSWDCRFVWVGWDRNIILVERMLLWA